MERIYVFILHNDVLILILASLGLIWYVSEYLRSRRLLQRAQFGLERERGSQLRNNSAIVILILTAVIAITFYVNDQIAPTLPADLLRPPTPTPNLALTPLASPTPLATLPPSPTPPLAPTITLASEPAVPPVSLPITNNVELTNVTPFTQTDTAVTSATPAPNPTPILGCNLQLTISQPRNGAVIAGSIEFFGTANTPDFGGYSLEANGPQTNGQWASLLGRVIEQPVTDGLLGNVNLSQWAAGPYLLRLTALDSDQVESYQCVIQITLEN